MASQQAHPEQLPAGVAKDNDDVQRSYVMLMELHGYRRLMSACNYDY
jgi:hypothetical protein